MGIFGQTTKDTDQDRSTESGEGAGYPAWPGCQGLGLSEIIASHTRVFFEAH